MTVRVRICTGLILALAFTGFAQGDEDNTYATSPSGKFRVIWNDGLAVASAESPGSPTPLAPVRVLTHEWTGEAATKHEKSSQELDEIPHVFISPNEEWIFIEHGVDGEEFRIAALYHRNTSKALGFDLANKERFDELAWKFLARQEKIDFQTIGMEREPDERRHRSVQFVDWSTDSARLLISLNGSIGVPTEKFGSFEKGLNSWLCYFNTRTGEFELTERLRTFNRDARKRWNNPSPDVALANFPLTAESMGAEGPWEPTPERFKRADQRLNAVFGQLLKRLTPPEQEKLRQEEREWLIQRDTEAAIYLQQSWSPAASAAEAEGLAIATETRTAELERRLAGDSRPK